MGRIFMARHGQASFGQKNYDNLSEKGRNQSRILAEYLIRTGLVFHAVYAGDLSRQQDTAREVIHAYESHGFPALPLQTLTEFNEYRSREIMVAYMDDVAREDPALQNDLENRYHDRKAFSRVFGKVMLRWMSGEDDKPGLMTWADFRSGVRSGLREVMTASGRGKNILICTSGGPISVAVQMALDLSDENAFRMAWHVVNTSVTTFVYNKEQFSLASFNQQGHLDLASRTDWVTYW